MTTWMSLLAGAPITVIKFDWTGMSVPHVKAWVGAGSCDNGRGTERTDGSGCSVLCWLSTTNLTRGSIRLVLSSSQKSRLEVSRELILH